MADSKELQLTMARRRHERNAAALKLIPNENGNGFSFTSPGFQYRDINRAGVLNFPRVIKHLEAARYRYLSDFGLKICEHRAFFMLQTHIEFSMELYKTPGLTDKLKVINELSHIGNSTISYRLSLTNEASGEVLAIQSADHVHVDTSTRKAEPFSPHFKQQVKSILSGSPIRSSTRLILPAVDKNKCHCCTIVVRNIDMDDNNHTTQNKYVEYTLESAAKATASGYYKKLHGDACGYCVKNAHFLHMGESSVGDELLVMTWEDESNPLLIYFVIGKNMVGGPDICHAKIEFFHPNLHSNL